MISESVKTYMAHGGKAIIGDSKEVIMKLINIDLNVMDWAPRGQIIAILYKDKAISILPGFLPKFFSSCIYLQIKCMARPKHGAKYQYIGYGFQFLPALNSAVAQWPQWYAWLWIKASWRNYDASGILKGAAA